MSRQLDVTDARAAADEWAAARGLPPSGGYSGDWYVNGYLAGWWPDGWLYWQANYGAPPELLPMRPVVQFTSTPIDTDVMLESEIVTSTPTIPPVDPCATYKDAIARAVNRLQIELAKRSLNKKIIAEIQSELFQALQA
jgi:hypothetical protein